MRGLTVNNIYLEQVLAPVARELDDCWWYLGGAGMTFPRVRPPRPFQAPDPQRPPGRQERRKARREAMQRPASAPRYDPADWQRYVDEMDAARREYNDWLGDGPACGFGRPGFFSRYAAGMDLDWKTYFASDAPDPPATSFNKAVSRFERVWFDPPPDDLPADICLIVRSVDAAYLDLFFRDDRMFRSVWGHLEVNGMKPVPHKSLDVEGSKRGRK